MCVTDLSTVFSYILGLYWVVFLSGFMLLVKQGVQNHITFYDVHIGHFFYNVSAVSFGPVYIQIYHRTNKLT